MKRDFRGRFTAKKNQINSFITGVVWQRMKLAGMIFVFAFAVSAWTVYKLSTPTQIEAETKTVIVEAKRELPKVLQNIGDCESGLRDKNGKAIKGSRRQFDKNGQVVENVNMTGQYAGTIDVGELGINKKFWSTQAKELGLNLYTEEGNEAMGMWLLDHYGTEPWHYTSGSCWGNK